jgi:hypothetical protein
MDHEKYGLLTKIRPCKIVLSQGLKLHRFVQLATGLRCLHYAILAAANANNIVGTISVQMQSGKQSNISYL